MTLCENIAKVVKTYFDKETAVHSSHILNENIEAVNSGFYDIPEYRLQYFFNTFPLFVLYLISNYDNAEYMNRFLRAVDRWPVHNSLAIDEYPSQKVIHTYDYSDTDISENLLARLTESSEVILDPMFEDMIALRAANVSEDHKYMIGAVVDKFALYFKMLAYETTFHKYRNLIDFIYYIQLKYEFYRYRLEIRNIDEAKFKSKTANIDISDDAIAAYVWYEDGDFYDTMFDTGYTGSEWK